MMSTRIRRVASGGARPPGRLLGARQLEEVARRHAASPQEWLSRVRLTQEGRWYERIHLDEAHEVWAISWLPGQGTGFHDHGGSAGAFAVVWGTLLEWRVTGPVPEGPVLVRPVSAGAARSFGPRYVHDVRNAAPAAVAVSVHAYSPPLPAMTRYELTPGGLVRQEDRGRGGVVTWSRSGRPEPGSPS
jgi:predicted metal-dependent enzyme (double-stranded beta helix superfamily)